MSLLACGNGLGFGQQVAELAAVHLDAVIGIEGDALVGIVPQEIVKDSQLGLRLLE